MQQVTYSIEIVGIDVTQVGTPTNDGSAGSALYRVPLRLSGRPSKEWADAFVSDWNTFDHPRASISGNLIVFEKADVRHIETCLQSLQISVHRVNEHVTKWRVTQQVREQDRMQRDAELAQRHKSEVEEVAGRINEKLGGSKN